MSMMESNQDPDAVMHVDSDLELEAEAKSDVAIISPHNLEDENMDKETDVVTEASDFEAMKKIIFPPIDPEYEIIDEQVSTWDIEEWRKMPRKVRGPIFEAGGHPWRILFFPMGNNVEYASVYLEHAYEPAPPEDWYSCVQFALVLWNPNEPSNYVYHQAHHRFTKEDGDWGFTRFAEFRKLFSVQEGKKRPTVEDESCKLTAYVRVIKDPTGILWHNFLNYDSKKQTGYVGLRNQGATCYLNSLIQSLYVTNSFRRAVFQIPTENEDLSNSALALQRLFYQLQNAKDAVDTNELTKSFGWDAKQIFAQQDVQELSRKLMESLEEKMKGTQAENALAKMFVGKMRTYIDCINVKYTSSRVEDYWDIQLNVRGMGNLEASFRDYISVETLEGDNKYFAEGYGLQDAKKGVIFESFPSVMHLHLKRFEYDFMRDEMMKVNDHYEFPLKFDASPYLANEADKSEPWIYVLHGVLVHSGDFNAGHYYAYLKPTKDGFFYRFDDERVTRATESEVTKENFGGDHGANGVPNRNEYARINTNIKRSMSAYMLVYIRESRIDEILPELTPEDTPAHLEKRFEEERALREAKRKERDEQHLYLEVKIAHEKIFRQHQGIDLCDWEGKDLKAQQAESHKVLRALTVGDFTKALAEQLGTSPEKIRLWVMVNRQNKTVRPDTWLTDMDQTMEDAASKHASKNQAFRLWIETQDDLIKSPSIQDPKAVNNIAFLLFLKYFDAKNQCLKGFGTMYVRKQDKVGDLIKPLCEAMGWPEKMGIKLFEEIKPQMIEPMKCKQTFQQAEIQDGDIICFQEDLSSAQIAELQNGNTGAIADAKEFYEYLANKVTVVFSPRYNESELPKFELDLNKKVTYDQLAQRVADQLKVSSTHLRFTTVTVNGTARTNVKRSGQRLDQILMPTSYGLGSTLTYNNNLLYEVLELSLSELETKKSVRLTWLPEGISKEESHEFLVPKQGQLVDIVELLQEKAKFKSEDMPRLRFFLGAQGKFQKDLDLNFSVAGLQDYTTLYAELAPLEELELKDDERVVYAFHFYREPSKAHVNGVPFKFVVKAGEPFSETRARLQNRTGIKGKQFEKIKFAVVQKASFSKPKYLEDDDILSDIIGEEDLLGLDHVDKSARSLWGRAESAIFIR